MHIFNEKVDDVVKSSIYFTLVVGPFSLAIYGLFYVSINVKL